MEAAVLWAAAAIVLGIAAEAVGWTETLAAGRPIGAHLTYLCVLATLAALISVLGARTPGAGAWALLMGMLVLVLLIPWLEAPTPGAGNVDGLAGSGPRALCRSSTPCW